MSSNYERAFEPDERAGSAARFRRVTRGGRTIHYELSVLQQPERARACGSGPKSSADRRPVDPPPIVKMSVFEGADRATAKDITFDYPAEFFLYVSLENARPMVHGRVQTPAATTTPVLTGMPCSSCVYLDRPAPAGYFLFPDLSVRHEGMYRLIFRLYEQNKDELDLNPASTAMDTMSCPTDDGTHFFTHITEIYSQPFQVFSAKKFPGLTESTALSRTVAEQGCRVRIRRDVRMRRRDTKNNGGAEKREEEYARQPPRPPSPDPYRGRSASNSSMDRIAYPGPPRRPSEYSTPSISAPSLSVAPSGGILDFRQSSRYQPPSEPVSPATSLHHRGSIAYPPTPTSAVAPPFAPRRPSSTIDERRSSTSYSYPSFSNSRSSNMSLPPIDPGLKSLQVDRSPVSSHSNHSAPESHYPPIQPKKRSYEESARPDLCHHPVLSYRRSGGYTAQARPIDSQAKYHSTYLDPRLRGNYLENLKVEAEETGPRKRHLRA